MEIAEILAQPEGFTPPAVTVKIDKVFAYKSGDSENGPWSYQDVKVIGGATLKLKSLPEFPASRVGQTVTIKANQSKQHGLTGLKVAHEEWNNKTYDKLVITNSAKWEWGSSGNGAATPATAQQTVSIRGPITVPDGDASSVYADHILACAGLAKKVSDSSAMNDDQAIQACFATIVIDTKNRNILLPKPSANGHAPETQPEAFVPDEEEENNGVPF